MSIYGHEGAVADAPLTRLMAQDPRGFLRRVGGVSARRSASGVVSTTARRHPIASGGSPMSGQFWLPNRGRGGISLQICAHHPVSVRCRGPAARQALPMAARGTSERAHRHRRPHPAPAVPRPHRQEPGSCATGPTSPLSTSTHSQQTRVECRFDSDESARGRRLVLSAVSARTAAIE